MPVLVLQKPLPVPPSSPNRAPQHSTTASSHSSTTSRRKISFHPPTHFFTTPHYNPSTLPAVVQLPAVLAALIGHLDWPDVYHLLTTCKPLNACFNLQPHRDLILSRFVPLYFHSLYDCQFNRCQEIPLSLADLDLLLISQRVPLHRYPMQALKSLSSLYPSLDVDPNNAKFAALANAHSRFVLMLQALVHSSSTPAPPEPEELRFNSRFSQADNIRELTFPAPLSYAQTPQAPLTHVRHKSRRSASSDRVNVTHPLSAANPPRPSADSLSSMMSKERTLTKGRLSIFGKKGYEIPPPLAEPRALKLYTSWKRSAFLGDADDSGVLEPPLKRPHRRFVSMNGSSDSSISGSPPRQSSSSPSRNSITGAEFPNSNGGGALPLRMTSPHDLALATSRSRAPVLRVFVPCTTLDEASESVLACEQQLVDAGLWDYLSIGDIVCNLGYIPPPPLDEPSSDGSSDQAPRSPPSNTDTNTQRTWLLFNGEYLVPYTPPDVIPLEMPLNLPSPFYYAHIMPPSANMVYTISHLPVCDDVPQLTLVHLTSRVRSPHSPKGVALVRKHAWTARVVRTRGVVVGNGGGGGDDQDMGDGWFGEWVLEGEGTMEGRLFLIDALSGRDIGTTVCELVREKSGAGRLWIKLLHT